MAENTPASGANESAWSYRGYHLRPPDFTTGVMHCYRSETQRLNTYRMRLDNTTKWITIATLVVIFSFVPFSLANHHSILFLLTLLVTLFLWMEASLYHHSELWGYHDHLIETGFFHRYDSAPHIHLTPNVRFNVETLLALMSNRGDAIPTELKLDTSFIFKNSTAPAKSR